ncbi:hypothetical protein GBAR_LOCUS30128 [Geodia barretti]|uniref:Uncharacterized protein n=1 Tax=Geodia barretti TaxID=519541 RepID=A0AA35TVW6_GEOBA|nr:hypothetical protein GBAR_LOCUS30128 [Geodia barretti]
MVWTLMEGLRMSRLKQEERGYVEEQVAEVYKDFEVAVQVDPERMKRRSQASSDTSSIASRELK